MNKKELKYQRQRADKIINEKFQVSCMSNSKWVKLIKCLVDNCALFNSCEVKLIWDNNLRSLFIDENTSYNFDYYETAMEAMITGYPKGFYEYKEIEWINLHSEPRKSPDKVNNQKLESLSKAISKYGHFEMIIEYNGLKIFNYK